MCRLNQSLYSLKQASRQWLVKFTKAILVAGFTQSKANYFYSPAMIVYVDDIVIIGNNVDSINSLKKFLHTRFCIKGLDDLGYFTRVEVSRSKEEIYISQGKYAFRNFQKSWFFGC